MRFPTYLLRLLAVIAISSSAAQGHGGDDERGVSMSDFTAGLENREKWQAVLRAVTIEPSVVARLRAAGAGVRFFIVADGDCVDSLNTLPYLVTLAERAGVPYGILPRRSGQEVLAAHLTKDGREATPTVVIFRNERELGVWVERSTVIQGWLDGLARRSSPQEVHAALTERYMTERGRSALDEILTICELDHSW